MKRKKKIFQYRFIKNRTDRELYMAMAMVKVRLSGEEDLPLIMHSSALANPLGVASKELKAISSKRKKVDADHEEMARLEFKGALYLGREGRIIIPKNVLDAVILAGAKKSKRGTAFKSQVFCKKSPELNYEKKDESLTGHDLIKYLLEDEDFRLVVPVCVGQSTIMRTRPKFNNWSLDTEFEYFGEVDRDAVVKALEDAGKTGGIGDWRPRYGRFSVEVLA
jgi:hypothetical protein